MIATLFAAFQRSAPGELIDAARALRDAGHAIYVVGGCVRDLVLDQAIEDWDLATSATPTEVAASFDRTTLLHERHGTTQVRLGGWSFEVTTFREDGPYSDGRRPDHVSFVSDVRTDLARRDFTVNAMAMDPFDGTLVDPFGGIEDARARVLRAVGDPTRRFEEDALRLLRAARFVATLGFDPEPGVVAAMRAEAPAITRVAAERIRDELAKMLRAVAPARGFDLLAETSLLEHVLPELAAGRGVTQNEYHAYDVYEHSVRACDHAPPEKPAVRWAALFHDLGKVATRELREGRVTFYGHEQASAVLVETRMRHLRFPRREIERVAHLVRHHMFHFEEAWSEAAVRRFVARVGLEHLDDLFDLRVADTLARGPGEAAPPELALLRQRIDAERARSSAFAIRDLAIDGEDVKALLGLDAGPAVGEVLDGLLDFVLSGAGENTREALLAEARRQYGRGMDPDGPSR